MERNLLLQICDTQIFAFEEFKNFDQDSGAEQVQNAPMEVVVAYGQFQLFIQLKEKLQAITTETVERQSMIDWLSNRTASQYKGYDFGYSHSSAFKVKNSELDVKLAYADWDASQTILSIIIKDEEFCTNKEHIFP